MSKIHAAEPGRKRSSPCKIEANPNVTLKTKQTTMDQHTSSYSLHNVHQHALPYTELTLDYLMPIVEGENVLAK